MCPFTSDINGAALPIDGAGWRATEIYRIVSQ
jgi:hypothetical protein